MTQNAFARSVLIWAKASRVLGNTLYGSKQRENLWTFTDHREYEHSAHSKSRTTVRAWDGDFFGIICACLRARHAQARYPAVLRALVECTRCTLFVGSSNAPYQITVIGHVAEVQCATGDDRRCLGTSSNGKFDRVTLTSPDMFRFSCRLNAFGECRNTLPAIIGRLSQISSISGKLRIRSGIGRTKANYCKPNCTAISYPIKQHVYSAVWTCLSD